MKKIIFIVLVFYCVESYAGDLLDNAKIKRINLK